jgi:hypothetical protein
MGRDLAPTRAEGKGVEPSSPYRRAALAERPGKPYPATFPIRLTKGRLELPMPLRARCSEHRVSADSTTWSRKSTHSGRRGSRTLKAHRSAVFETAAIAIWLALPHIETTQARCPCDTGPVIALGSLWRPGVSEASCAEMNNPRVDLPAGRRNLNLSALSNWVVNTSWEYFFVSLVEQVVDAGYVEWVRLGRDFVLSGSDHKRRA